MSKKLFLFLIFILFILFIIGCTKEPTKVGTQAMLQYTGISKECNPPPITPNNEAIIGDYRITTEVSFEQSIYKFLGCKDTSSCNGGFVKTDEYGCDVYRRTWTMSCGLDHSVQCTCFTEPDWQQCGDRQVECRKSPCGCSMYSQEFTCGQDDCGGANLETIKSGGDCYSKHKIYYKDDLVYETQEWIWDNLYLYLKEGQQVAMGQHDLEIVFHYKNQYVSNWFNLDCYGGHERVERGCYYIENYFTIKKQPEDISILIENAEFDGINLNFKTKITNTQNELRGDLNLKITIDYAFLGQNKTQSQDFNYQINVPNGETMNDYSFPIDVNANKITIDPKLTLISPSGSIKGVNYYCYPLTNWNTEQDVSNCDVSLGDLIGIEVILDIGNPCETDIDCIENAKCKEQKAECINSKCVISGECKKSNLLIWIISSLFVITLIIVGTSIYVKLK